MHIIKITPNLIFEYQCTSGKFIRLPNRIVTFFARIGMLYSPAVIIVGTLSFRDGLDLVEMISCIADRYARHDAV